MADTPASGETVTPPAPKNDITNPPAPATVKPEESIAAIAEARKEAEQARMRANQLENQVAELRKADEERNRKQMEANEEWKQLAEQEKAKRESLESEREADKKAAELKAATSDVFAGFPAEVLEIAKEAGMALTDTTDEAKEALKAKLQNIQAKVVSDRPVTPNNHAKPSNAQDRAALIAQMRAGDKDARAKVIGSIPGVEAMRKMAGYSPQE